VVLAFALLSALLYFTNLRLKNDLAAIRSSAQAQESQLQQSRTMVDLLKSSTAVRARLHAAEDAGRPEGEAIYDRAGGNLILLVSDLPTVSSEKTYQFWLLQERGAPVSAGTFRPDDRGNAAVIQSSFRSGLEVNDFGISVEQRGGADAPTGAMILKGSAPK
jgi:hypothetical protein